jgi:hypothetical protein
MKAIILIATMFLASCASVPQSTRAAESMMTDPELQEDARYIERVYADTWRDEAIYARNAAIVGKNFLSRFDQVSDQMELVEFVKIQRQLLTGLIDSNLSVWAGAIKSSVQGYSIEFGQALAIHKDMLERKSVYAFAEGMMIALKKIIRNGGGGHADLYVAMNEMTQMAIDPTGNLMNYRNTTNDNRLRVNREVAKLELSN